MSRPIQKSYLIEAIVPGVSGTGNLSTKIQLLDQPFLRNKPVTGIEVFTDDDCSTSPQQNTVVSLANIQKAYLTLYASNQPENLTFQNIPFTRLHCNQYATGSVTTAGSVHNKNLFEIADQVFDWSKCFVTLGAALANTSNKSILILVHYKDPGK